MTSITSSGKERFPLKRWEWMIYRSIDPTLCQETTANKQAYSQILYISNKTWKPSVSGSEYDGKEDSGSKEKPKEASCNVCTLIRRERRAKARIKTLQKSLRDSKRKNKIQEEKIEHLSAALKETRTLLYESYTHITHLWLDLRKGGTSRKTRVFVTSTYHHFKAVRALGFRLGLLAVWAFYFTEPSLEPWASLLSWAVSCQRWA